MRRYAWLLGMLSSLLVTTPGNSSDASPAWSPWLQAADGSSESDLHIGGAALSVHIDDDHLRVSHVAVQRWVTTAARSLIGIYGSFPVPTASILIQVDDQRGPHHGVTYAGTSITLHLGRESTAEDLAADWILTHEMVHLAFPGLVAQHLWMEEGLATYLEPLARVRIGDISTDEFWKGLIEGLPNGLPDPHDPGLDQTTSWGRTYWGGCLFWFMADIHLHSVSANRQGIDDLLHALRAAGQDGRSQVRMLDICSTADATFGNHVFSTLERSQAHHSTAMGTDDLDHLFRDLGVSLHRGTLRYDDGAPLAATRRALTHRSEEGPGRGALPSTTR